MLIKNIRSYYPAGYRKCQALFSLLTPGVTKATFSLRLVPAASVAEFCPFPGKLLPSGTGRQRCSPQPRSDGLPPSLFQLCPYSQTAGKLVQQFTSIAGISFFPVHSSDLLSPEYYPVAKYPCPLSRQGGGDVYCFSSSSFLLQAFSRDDRRPFFIFLPARPSGPLSSGSACEFSPAYSSHRLLLPV